MSSVMAACAVALIADFAFRIFAEIRNKPAPIRQIPDVVIWWLSGTLCVLSVVRFAIDLAQ
jgi:hypothetical protein